MEKNFFIKDVSLPKGTSLAHERIARCYDVVC